MLKIETTDHGTFEAPSEWKDITLKQFEAVSAIEIPEKLVALWKTNPDEKKEWEARDAAMTTEDHIKINADYFRAVMDILTTMPKNILEITEWSLVTDFYYETLHQFVISMIYQVPMAKKGNELVEFEPKAITRFTYRGEIYKLPSSLRVFGDEIPMANEPIVTFAESADIEIALNSLAEKGTEKFALIIAIYARKDKEPYDQKTALQQAERFRNLDMETAWQVFFYILELYAKFMKSTAKFLTDPDELLRRNKRTRVAAWKTSTIEA